MQGAPQRPQMQPALVVVWGWGEGEGGVGVGVRPVRVRVGVGEGEPKTPEEAKWRAYTPMRSDACRRWLDSRL